MWLYIRDQKHPSKFYVGFLRAQGHFQETRTYTSERDAMQCVNYLNGGSGRPYLPFQTDINDSSSGPASGGPIG